MKNFAKLLLLVGVLFSALSLTVSGGAFFVTLLTAGHVGGDVPMFYYEKLNLEWLTILLPLAAITAFLLALPGLLSERKASEESTILTFPAKAAADDNRQHLKAA